MSNPTLEDIKKHYYACFECNSKAGGKFPKGHICTMSEGKCEVCGKEDTTLIPWVDFNWPNDTNNDLIAKRNRD
jgi:hypothetical protein